MQLIFYAGLLYTQKRRGDISTSIFFPAFLKNENPSVDKRYIQAIDGCLSAYVGTLDQNDPEAMWFSRKGWAMMTLDERGGWHYSTEIGFSSLAMAVEGGSFNFLNALVQYKIHWKSFGGPFMQWGLRKDSTNSSALVLTTDFR